MWISYCAKWSIVLGLVLAAGCSTSSGDQPAATSLQPITVKFNWFHGIQFLGYYVAQNHGNYTDEGLDVTLEPLKEITETNHTPAQIAAGEIDFATGGTALFADKPGLDIAIIAAIYQFEPTVFFTRVDSGIVTPADFGDKRIVIKAEGWRLLLAQLIEQVGLTLDDVIEVPGGFDMTPFYEGEVDVWAGYITDEVVRARLHGLDIVTFPLAEYGIRYQGNLIYTRRSTLETNPDKAVRFVRATRQGWDWAVEHPTEAVDLMLEMFPELADDRAFHLASFEASIPLIQPGGTPIGTLDCAEWQETILFTDLDLWCTTQIMEQVWGSE